MLFRSVADAAGNVSVGVASLPSGACGSALVAVDMSTCDPAEGVIVQPRNYNVEFPRSSSVVSKSGSGLGTISSGWYIWTAGDYVEDTYAGTGLSSITGLTFTLRVTDATNGVCGYIPWYEYDIYVNGNYESTVRYPRGNNYGLTTFYAAAGFSGPVSAAAGTTYTIRMQAADTICGGGGSYKWEAGGSTWLVR